MNITSIQITEIILNSVKWCHGGKHITDVVCVCVCVCVCVLVPSTHLDIDVVYMSPIDWMYAWHMVVRVYITHTHTTDTQMYIT